MTRNHVDKALIRVSKIPKNKGFCWIICKEFKFKTKKFFIRENPENKFKCLIQDYLSLVFEFCT